MRPFVLSLTGFLLLASASCQSDGPTIGDPACDNLDQAACLFPFPSDFFRRPGGPFAQEFHLDLGSSLPTSEVTSQRMSAEPFKVHDGYPVVPAVTFVLEGASLTGAPSLDDIAASLDLESKTLILDAETGERQPHWAEFDYLAEDAGVRVIQLRLANTLRHDRRYIVAVRGFLDDEGQPVEATPGFAALRDGVRTSIAGIAERRSRYETEVLDVLDGLAIPRAELQLAWDFTTTSEQGSINWLLAMRDRLYEQIGALGPEYAIDDVVVDPDGPDGDIGMIIEATAYMPSFVLPPEAAAFPRRLRLDDSGLPVAEGYEDVPFRVQVPRNLLSAQGTAAVLQYGHGFLGSDDEANNAWLREWAVRQGFMILSSDMQGMNLEAAVTWFFRLREDATHIAHISEEPLQGVINHFALQRLMKGRFLSEPAIQYQGEAMYDPERLYYHGNSQGGTMGNLVVLPSLDVTRGALGVPGVSIGFILARASQWQELAGMIQTTYPNPYEFASIMSLVQIGWDKTDAINFAPRWADLPGTPPKQVLLQAALGDSQVNIDVTRLLARLYQARLIEPATQEVFGLETAPSPVTGQNAYQEVDFGVAPPTQTNRPASSETDTHSLPRRMATLQDQAWHFLENGEAIAVCDGVCDPE